jgi:hypothetical protein
MPASTTNTDFAAAAAGADRLNRVVEFVGPKPEGAMSLNIRLPGSKIAEKAKPKITRRKS